GARSNLRARGTARAERHPAGRGRAGGGARPGSVGGRVAAAAAARGGRRLVDPDRPGGADGLVTVVSDVKERGLEAVREWALELDGAEPARAQPDDDDLPR